jgi:hypothetical protein
MGKRATIFLVLGLMMAGCGRIPTLQNHINELLEKHTIQAVVEDARMIGRYRLGLCLLKIAPEQVIKLAQNLNLQEITSNQSESDQDLSSWESEAGSFSPAVIWKENRIRVYKSCRRVAELKLEDGSQFEYLVLYHNLDTDQVWLQVCYAYS